jgi:hypothetical protein
MIHLIGEPILAVQVVSFVHIHPLERAIKSIIRERSISLDYYFHCFMTWVGFRMNHPGAPHSLLLGRCTDYYL